MRYLSKEQLRRLLEVARAENERDYLCFLVAYLHAGRCTEIVNLHKGKTSKRIPCVRGGKPTTIPVSYVDGDFIAMFRLKGSECTVQKLVESSDPLFNEKALLASLPDGPIFKGYTRHTMSNRFRKIAKLAGIPQHFGPHSLKHSCLYHAVKSATINELQAYAGHKSGASTLRYLVCDQETASRAVVSALVAA